MRTFKQGMAMVVMFCGLIWGALPAAAQAPAGLEKSHQWATVEGGSVWNTCVSVFSREKATAKCWVNAGRLTAAGTFERIDPNKVANGDLILIGIPTPVLKATVTEVTPNAEVQAAPQALLTTNTAVSATDTPGATSMARGDSPNGPPKVEVTEPATTPTAPAAQAEPKAPDDWQAFALLVLAFTAFMILAMWATYDPSDQAIAASLRARQAALRTGSGVKTQKKAKLKPAVIAKTRKQRRQLLAGTVTNYVMPSTSQALANDDLASFFDDDTGVKTLPLETETKPDPFVPAREPVITKQSRTPVALRKDAFAKGPKQKKAEEPEWHTRVNPPARNAEAKANAKAEAATAVIYMLPRPVPTEPAIPSRPRVHIKRRFVIIGAFLNGNQSVPGVAMYRFTNPDAYALQVEWKLENEPDSAWRPYTPRKMAGLILRERPLWRDLDITFGAKVAEIQGNPEYAFEGGLPATEDLIALLKEETQKAELVSA